MINHNINLENAKRKLRRYTTRDDVDQASLAEVAEFIRDGQRDGYAGAVKLTAPVLRFPFRPSIHSG